MSQTPPVKLSPKQPPVENAGSKINKMPSSGHYYSLKNRRLQLRTMIRTGYRKSLEALLGPPGSYKNKNNNKTNNNNTNNSEMQKTQKQKSFGGKLKYN
jgi:hypothetical protein